MSDEIIELLENSKLWAKVVEALNDLYGNELYSYAKTLYEDPPEVLEEDWERYEEEERWWEACNYANDNSETCMYEIQLAFTERIELAFEKHVFAKMQKPYRISPEEIIERFYNLAYPGMSIRTFR
jgi:hypothetical protein